MIIVIMTGFTLLLFLDEVYVTWSRADNSSLPEGAYVRGGTLYIDNVQPVATGNYVCYGVNREGKVIFSLPTHLTVISKCFHFFLLLFVVI